MKQCLFLPLIVLFAVPVFAWELSDLEKEIINAGPEEMIRLIRDRSREREMAALYQRINDPDNEDAMYASYEAAFPEESEDVYAFMLLKAATVCGLVSSDLDDIRGLIEAVAVLRLIFSGILDLIAEDDSGNTEEMWDTIGNRYMRDFFEFLLLFDFDAFIQERFPGGL